MQKQNDKWLNYAKKSWYLNYPGFAMDCLVGAFLFAQAPPPSQGWLKGARKALFLSTGEVAKKMSISRAAYSALETREVEGTISLNSLKKAAEALDCELVYAIRPKNRVRFSEVIWMKLTKNLLSASRTSIMNRMEAHRLLSAVSVRMRSPDFRRSQKWSER